MIVPSFMAGSFDTNECPCQDELQVCRECLTKSQEAPKFKDRNKALRKCNVVNGACSAFTRCQHRFMATLTDQEKMDFLIKCPWPDSTPEVAEDPECCVSIVCRPVGGTSDWTIGAWTATEHCAVEKVSCDGTRTVYEVQKGAPQSGGLRVEGVVWKYEGWGVMVPGRVDAPGHPKRNAPYRVRGSRKCWPCSHAQLGPTKESRECARVDDKLASRYPYTHTYDMGDASCNTFADWFYTEITGESRINNGCVTPWQRPGSSWDK